MYEVYVEKRRCERIVGQTGQKCRDKCSAKGLLSEVAAEPGLLDVNALQLRLNADHFGILLAFLLHIAPSPCSDTSIREDQARLG